MPSIQPNFARIIPLLLALTAASALAQETRPVPATQSQPQYWFGFSVDNIPPVFGRLLQLPPGHGLLVIRVVQQSPAERAGIMPGDLLIKLGQNHLVSPMQLIQNAQSPDHSVELTLIREGKVLKLNMQAELRPQDMRPIIGFAGPDSPIVQVGPGMVVDLGQADKVPTLRSVRTLTNGGQSVLLSQESDGQGHVHRRITVGENTYEIDPARLDDLPPEVRELARRMIETPQDRMRRELAMLKQAVKDLETRINAESATTAPATKGR